MEDFKKVQSNAYGEATKKLSTIANLTPMKAFLFSVVAFGVYGSLFSLFAWLISTMFGQPFWACLGLVFLMRLCLT